MTFEYYKSGREWRWRLVAGNGETIASGESYKQKVDCIKAIALVCQAGLGAFTLSDTKIEQVKK